MGISIAPMSHQSISILCWVVSGSGIAASLWWLAVAEDKGMAILGGIAAVGVARILVGDVARWHDQKDLEPDDDGDRDRPSE